MVLALRNSFEILAWESEARNSGVAAPKSEHKTLRSHEATKLIDSAVDFSSKALKARLEEEEDSDVEDYSDSHSDAEPLQSSSRHVRFNLSLNRIIYIEPRQKTREEKKAERRAAREEYRRKKMARQGTNSSSKKSNTKKKRK